MAYWEAQIRELDAALKSLRGDNLNSRQGELTHYSEIRRLFDGIAETLRDMNALPPEQHAGAVFEELIRRMLAQIR